MPEFHLDAICAALAAQKRRDVCRYVAAIDRDVVALDELTERVEPGARDGSSRSGAATEHETRTRLHHVDLPKLADAGVVEYDSERGVVTEGPDLPTAVDLVRAVEDASDRQKEA